MPPKKDEKKDKSRAMEVCYIERHPDPELIGLCVFMAEPGYQWAPSQRGIVDIRSPQIRMRVASVRVEPNQTAEKVNRRHYVIDPSLKKLEPGPKHLRREGA